jgi:transcriptional regulator with GAF, ATPase, and Fis domain
MQAKLLRVLEEKQVERIGGDRSIPVDVRVVVATHRNLDEMVERGAFRQDLYHRIYVYPLALPPLRERRKTSPRWWITSRGRFRKSTAGSRSRSRPKPSRS